LKKPQLRISSGSYLLTKMLTKLNKPVKILLVIFLLLAVADLFYLNYLVLSGERKMPIPSGASLDKETTRPPLLFPRDGNSEEECSSVCQQLIEEKINQAIATLSAEEKSRPAATVAPTQSIPATTYVPLGNGGSTGQRDWTTLSGSEFVFNLADYPKGTKAYWQANLKTAHANSRCFARIYDKTNLRAVDFSEQTTSKTDYETLLSQPLSIWSGENHYQVEIKSLDGSTCHLGSPRLLVKY